MMILLYTCGTVLYVIIAFLFMLGGFYIKTKHKTFFWKEDALRCNTDPDIYWWSAAWPIFLVWQFGAFVFMIGEKILNSIASVGLEFEWYLNKPKPEIKIDEVKSDYRNLVTKK